MASETITVPFGFQVGSNYLADYVLPKLMKSSNPVVDQGAQIVWDSADGKVGSALLKGINEGAKYTAQKVSNPYLQLFAKEFTVPKLVDVLEKVPAKTIGIVDLLHDMYNLDRVRRGLPAKTWTEDLTDLQDKYMDEKRKVTSKYGYVGQTVIDRLDPDVASAVRNSYVPNSTYDKIGHGEVGKTIRQAVYPNASYEE